MALAVIKDVKITLASLPETPGIYIYRDSNNNILYIGKAKILKRRISSYFQNRKSMDAKTASMIPQIYSIETIEVQSEFEALLLEAKLINLKQPKYNIIWKDDKHYIYILLTKEKFPRLLLSRKADISKGTYYGPFKSTRIARDILKITRTIFPYCTQNPVTKKPCFYTHLGLCDPCPGNITHLTGHKFLEERQKYLKNINRIKKLLSGQATKIKSSIKKEMQKQSRLMHYEEAAANRNILANLDYLQNNYEPPQGYMDNPKLTADIYYQQQTELKKLLNTYGFSVDNLERIECYDISNIQGKMATGSMVTFSCGKPDKRYYRHFNIRTVLQSNDFAMLNEVLTRRLKHTEWGFPQLIIVDGGKPQLMAIADTVKIMAGHIPVIGIAKREEEIVIPQNKEYIKIKLPNNSPSLHLVQRLRDEAHRFAHKQHELLRYKRMVAQIEKNKKL